MEDKTGTEKWNYILKGDYFGSLEVSDINNDGEKEIVFAGGTTGTLYIFNKTGSLLTKFSSIFPSSMLGEEVATLNNNYYGANTGIDFTNSFNGKKYLGFAAENSNVGAYKLYPECIIYYSDGISRRMYYNISAGLYYNNRSFSLSGDYTWNITCKSINHLEGVSAVKTLSVNPLLYASLTSPENNSYFSDELGNYSIMLNATIYDLNLNNLTVWFYGGYPNGTYSLINTAHNQTNGTSLTYNWTGLNLGQHNWSVVVNNGSLNSSQTYYYFNLINLTINCETGGAYRQNALVLINGNISNGISGLNSQSVNASLHKEGIFNISRSLTSLNDGSFQTSFSNLADGNYTLNTTFSYQGYNKSCVDNFTVGDPGIVVTPASFVLDKIASFYNLTNETFIYNITLRLTNKGGSNTTGVNVTDSDYLNSEFSIGSLGFGESITRSYVLNFTRNSTTYYNSTSIAQVYGIDSSANLLVSANSSSIYLNIPSQETGEQLTVIKNIIYNNQTSSDVNYTVSVQVVNSGGVDVINAVLIDSDLNKTGANSLTIPRLNRTESYALYGEVIITKVSENYEYPFDQTTVTGTRSYGSNEITILIPGSGNGPNDLTVDAPASVITSTAYSTTITIVNMNNDIGQDFTIDYWVTNTLNTTNYSIGSKTLFVAANSGSNSTIANFNSPSTAGNYIFMAKVRESGKEASDSFVVNSPSSENTGGNAGVSSGGGGSITGKVTEEIVCPIPYMRYGKECCLDKNNNSICDKDETPTISQKNEIATNETTGEETPKKESYFFDNIKNAMGNLGRFFSLIEENISQNKNYLFIGFGILIVLVGIIALIRAIIKRKSKKITEYVKLKETKQISFGNYKQIRQDGYLEIKPKLIENIKNENNRDLETPASKKNIFLKINELLSNLFGKYKKYPSNSISGLISKKVYSESGHYLGKVNDIILGENRIDSLKINIDKKHEFDKKGIIVSYRHVKSVGEIVIIDEAFFEHLENLCIGSV